MAPTSSPDLRVMAKAGMKLEGTLRQQVLKWDSFEDLVIYGILASDLDRPSNS